MIRLLTHSSNNDFELTSFTTDDPPPYAILSHTWTDGAEVTYDELVTGARKDKAGYAKIRFCGERAAHDGLQYFWVDTCCIDKSSSAELTEALNSMFRWYQSSAKCYVYLSDVSSSRLPWEDAFLGSRWFIRGWTLQELIAPEVVEFYTADVVQLGDKLPLEGIIHKASGITVRALRNCPIFEFGIEERFSWATHRQTKRPEDKAYCLLGIFGVAMPVIYGEGAGKALS